ncbi:unnamed protein product [Phaeothamnion confervicola]
MRLITHNMLRSNVRGVEQGYPLGIDAQKTEEREIEFDPDFVVNMLGKIDWEALRGAASALGVEDLPPASDLPGGGERPDDALLRRVHHALLEVHVLEGALICPETGRRFPIHGGIPNMLLHDDEVPDA